MYHYHRLLIVITAICWLLLFELLICIFDRLCACREWHGSNTHARRTKRRSDYKLDEITSLRNRCVYWYSCCNANSWLNDESYFCSTQKTHTQTYFATIKSLTCYGLRYSHIPTQASTFGGICPKWGICPQTPGGREFWVSRSHPFGV